MSVSMTADASGPTAADPDFRLLKEHVERRLAELVPEGRGPAEAARHSLLAPGKRLRAILTMIAAAECDGDPLAALDVACAVEMIHTASLIFDDLPAMDDADLRRGVTTPHVLYGVDVAILAGIGLLNGAFGAVAMAVTLSAPQKVQISEILSQSVGWTGLVGGQALDLSSGENDACLEDIHDGKTGVLFEAAALSGAASAGALDVMSPALKRYACYLGRAYQAFDDILDQVADDTLAGKSTSRDEGKLTAITQTGGMDEALAEAKAHLEAAKNALPKPDMQETPLRLFTDHIFGHFEKAFRQSGLKAS